MKGDEEENGPEIHRVKGGNLIDLHGRYVEDLGNLIHGSEGQPSVLLLGKMEERHRGTLFVLCGILCDDVLDLDHVLVRKLKGRGLVVVWCVDVLPRPVSRQDKKKRATMETERQRETEGGKTSPFSFETHKVDATATETRGRGSESGEGCGREGRERASGEKSGSASEGEHLVAC